MQAQFDALLDSGWGSLCVLTRFSGSKNSAGHISGAFGLLLASGATERVWIQPIAGRSSISNINLQSETTHLAFQKHSGTALKPKDRILPAGETYPYDVTRAHVLESHRMAELKQDVRS